MTGPGAPSVRKTSVAETRFHEHIPEPASTKSAAPEPTSWEHRPAADVTHHDVESQEITSTSPAQYTQPTYHAHHIPHSQTILVTQPSHGRHAEPHTTHSVHFSHPPHTTHPSHTPHTHHSVHFSDVPYASATGQLRSGLTVHSPASSKPSHRQYVPPASYAEVAHASHTVSVSVQSSSAHHVAQSAHPAVYGKQSVQHVTQATHPSVQAAHTAQAAASTAPSRATQQSLQLSGHPPQPSQSVPGPSPHPSHTAHGYVPQSVQTSAGHLPHPGQPVPGYSHHPGQTVQSAPHVRTTHTTHFPVYPTQSAHRQEGPPAKPARAAHSGHHAQASKSMPHSQSTHTECPVHTSQSGQVTHHISHSHGSRVVAPDHGSHVHQSVHTSYATHTFHDRHTPHSTQYIPGTQPSQSTHGIQQSQPTVWRHSWTEGEAKDQRVWSGHEGVGMPEFRREEMGAHGHVRGRISALRQDWEEHPEERSSESVTTGEFTSLLKRFERRTPSEQSLLVAERDEDTLI